MIALSTNTMRVAYRRHAPRTLRLFWLIADQAVFAIGNFVMNVLFARWLSIADYGLYTVSFSGYLMLNVLHYGAVLEPLLVLSPQVEGHRRRPYIVTLMRVHAIGFALTAVLAAAGCLLATWLRAPTIGWVVVGAGLGGFALLALMTARRLCLAFISPRASALIGLLYSGGVLSTGYLLHRFNTVVWFDLWVIMGVWAAICAALIFRLLYRRTRGGGVFAFAELLHFQSRFGRWSIIAALCNWASFDGIYLLMARLLGLNDVALTRAVFNLANPLSHVNMALHASWLVGFSERHQRHRPERLGPTIVLYGLMVAPLVITLVLTAPWLVRLAYGGRYLAGAWELPVFVGIVGVTGFTAILTSLFKARGELWMGYCPNLASALVAVGSAVPLISRYGQPGVVYAIGAGATAAMLVSGALLVTVAKRRPTPTTEGVV